MENCSGNPNGDLVGSSPERILRDSQTTADTTNPLQDSDMESHLATLRVTRPWQDTATDASQNVQPNVQEEENEDELDM